MAKKTILSFFISLFLFSSSALAEQIKPETVKVGLATGLSGDFAPFGQNLVDTIETYKKFYLRHPIDFIYEDAKKDSKDGLTAYQKLIKLDKVQVLIGGTTSNGTIAAAPLVNSTQTVMITPLTGGSNIDALGPFIFRIGNSDILNGTQQADIFIEKGFKNVALLTEETEYTTDIAKHFREKFKKLDGNLIYDRTFIPNDFDFRTQVIMIRVKKPDAVLVLSQTGLAFGMFVKTFKEMLPEPTSEIHSNFVAADNPDALKAAGENLYGVYYMSPEYDEKNPKLKKFIEQYKEMHGHYPNVMCNAMGTVDALDMLQNYLDTHETYKATEFREYLLETKNYHGLMGTYSFDKHGNSDLGFRLKQIQKEK
jgi:branched-chain amino acid transport system substrate-binding protein